mmetsp:Transcript_100130/g.289090  ORF Transcript_100130/g.289090 Transcript_100130/m.289090 type:complete len:216 (+) Transcript_100130:2088-2735(+)
MASAEKHRQRRLGPSADRCNIRDPVRSEGSVEEELQSGLKACDDPVAQADVVRRRGEEPQVRGSPTPVGNRLLVRAVGDMEVASCRGGDREQVLQRRGVEAQDAAAPRGGGAHPSLDRPICEELEAGEDHCVVVDAIEDQGRASLRGRRSYEARPSRQGQEAGAAGPRACEAAHRRAPSRPRPSSCLNPQPPLRCVVTVAGATAAGSACCCGGSP